MSHVKKPSNSKVLEFTMPQDGIVPQPVSRVRGVVKSNNKLVLTVERLRRLIRCFYLERSKNVFASHSAHEPQGALSPRSPIRAQYCCHRNTPQV
jgi:hypothetical protein